MPHVVTGRCVDCKYTDCCAVCPVDCFYEIDDPRMLVIDPDTCIDCQLCVPECPIHAIYEAEEVPAPYQEWIAKNVELFKTGKLEAPSPITPAEIGDLAARVCVGAPSATVYIDPQIRVA